MLIIEKTRLIVDTNILVSAAIGNGYSKKILELLEQTQKVEFCYSSDILEEYFAVSKYERIAKKYPLFQERVLGFLNSFLILAVHFPISKKFDILEDKDDNKFLDLAFVCNADYLITGNHLDFSISTFHETKIISPKEFWEKYDAT